MNTLKFTLGLIVALSLSACQSNINITDIPPTQKISHQPITLDKNCGDGNANLYDECGNQIDILNRAIQQAKDENKNVLIVYGGEWCIWCHVLDKYFQGQFRTFDYQWRDSEGDLSEWLMKEKVSKKEINQAKALNKYVAENFVVTHIEADNTNGKEAITLTGFDPDKIIYYPYIMVLNKEGKFVTEMPSTSAIENFEIRKSGGKEYRGYNRKILIEQLQKLKKQAVK